MFKDTFISVRDNIVKKVTNPFLSTFVGVWIVRNWEFVYSIFFFDDSYSLQTRLATIETYFINYSIGDALITVSITFGILIITFVFLSISRLIVNFFDKTVTPWTYKITDIGSVVIKENYQALESEISRLENRYQEEKETRLVLRDENERLEKRIGELISGDEEKSESEILEYNEADLGLDKIVDMLNESQEKSDVLSIITDIRVGEELDKRNSLVRHLVKFDIITFEEQSQRFREFAKFKVTDFGKKVIDRYLLS